MTESCAVYGIGEVSGACSDTGKTRLKPLGPSCRLLRLWCESSDESIKRPRIPTAIERFSSTGWLSALDRRGRRSCETLLPKRQRWHHFACWMPKPYGHRRVTRGRVFGDRRPQDLPQAGGLRRRLVRRAVGRMVAASVRHALDDVAIAQARHVHLDAFDQAHASGPLVGRVGVGDSLCEAAGADLEAPAGDLVDRRRRRDAMSRRFHRRDLTARVPVRIVRASAAAPAWARRPAAVTAPPCRRP